MATLNVRDMVTNKVYIDRKLVRDYSTQTAFYNECPLIESLGESVMTYMKTYRVMEDDNSLILSNGIYYNKNTDMLYTSENVYADWYSRLLMGYTINTFLVNKSYLSYPTQFTVQSGVQDSIVVIRNNMIGIAGLINNPHYTVYLSKDYLDFCKSVILWKNSDTYITQKVEHCQTHELYYSIHKLDKFTAYSRESQFSDFSTMMLNYANTVGMDITGIASIAAGMLFAAYGADKTTIVPWFLGIDTGSTITYNTEHEFSLESFTVESDDTEDIVYHGYLGLEYLYDYRYSDWLNTINALNSYLSDRFNVTVDMMKYIIPTVISMNGRRLGKYEKYFGAVKSTQPLTSFKLYQTRGILDAQIMDNSYVNTKSIFNSSWNDTTKSIADIKSEFYSVFPELESIEVDDLIDSIDDWMELVNSTSLYKPILTLSPVDYTMVFDTASLSSLYLYSMIIAKMMSDFSDSTYVDNSGSVMSFVPLYVFETNVTAIDVSTYINLSDSTRAVLYTTAILSLNQLFGISQINADIFNPQIFSDFNSETAVIDSYSGSSEFAGDSTVILNAIDDNVLDFTDTDETDVFFVSAEINEVYHDPLSASDIFSATYQNSVPSNQQAIEYTDETGSSTDQLMLSFTNDSTKLQYVPVHLASSNYVKIPYKGLLLLNDIIDGEMIQLDDLWIQRDYTTNSWMCKIRLLKYDTLNVERSINFQFVDGNEVSTRQPIVYEFGLGFELVSSENVGDMEILKVLYIIMNSDNASQNLYIEKVTENIDKLKIMFRKLTTDDVLLRSVIGYPGDESWKRAFAPFQG